VNQKRSHCVNQMGKTHSKTLSGTAWQGNGMVAAWERHAMCESAWRGSTGSHHQGNSLGKGHRTWRKTDYSMNEYNVGEREIWGLKWPNLVTN